MRPDFIVRQRESKNGIVSIFIPANRVAEEWMIERVSEQERALVSAQLTTERANELRDAAKEVGFTFSDEMIKNQTA